MGMGKFLSLVIIFSIAVMLSFSILPAAIAFDARDGKKCPGEGNSPWQHVQIMRFSDRVEVDSIANGGNGNGWVCILTKGANTLIKDDR